jgi:hypothetical protein
MGSGRAREGLRMEQQGLWAGPMGRAYGLADGLADGLGRYAGA